MNASVQPPRNVQKRHANASEAVRNIIRMGSEDGGQQSDVVDLLQDIIVGTLALVSGAEHDEAVMSGLRRNVLDQLRASRKVTIAIPTVDMPVRGRIR